jgi:hypothetical protein
VAQLLLQPLPLTDRVGEQDDRRVHRLAQRPGVARRSSGDARSPAASRSAVAVICRRLATASLSPALATAISRGPRTGSAPAAPSSAAARRPRRRSAGAGSDRRARPGSRGQRQDDAGAGHREPGPPARGLAVLRRGRPALGDRGGEQRAQPEVVLRQGFAVSEEVPQRRRTPRRRRRCRAMYLSSADRRPGAELAPRRAQRRGQVPSTARGGQPVRGVRVRSSDRTPGSSLRGARNVR